MPLPNNHRVHSNTQTVPFRKLDHEEQHLHLNGNFHNPKTLFQHLQIRTRLFNNLQNLQIVLSMRNKAIKYLKWHPSRIQHHNF